MQGYRHPSMPTTVYNLLTPRHTTPSTSSPSQPPSLLFSSHPIPPFLPPSLPPSLSPSLPPSSFLPPLPFLLPQKPTLPILLHFKAPPLPIPHSYRPSHPIPHQSPNPSPPTPNPHLPLHQPPQTTPIPQIHPLPPSPPLRIFHPIIPLRPTHRTTQPNLPVRRLLVQHIGAVRGQGERQDAGGVFDVDVWAGLG